MRSCLLLTLVCHVPQYMLGLVLMFIFAIMLNLLPFFGAYSPGNFPEWSLHFILDMLKHTILPALSILFSAVGFWAIGMRGMMINTQGEDFMIQADAKGSERNPDLLSGTRSGTRLLPQVTGLAISFGTLLDRARCLVEVLFQYPGLGNTSVLRHPGFGFLPDNRDCHDDHHLAILGHDGHRLGLSADRSSRQVLPKLKWLE